MYLSKGIKDTHEREQRTFRSLAMGENGVPELTRNRFSGKIVTKEWKGKLLYLVEFQKFSTSREGQYQV